MTVGPATMTDYPSIEAMKSAVELEIQACINNGHVATVVIGQLIQKAIDASLAAQADVRAAAVGGVDVSGLADCFDHNELRGRSPIREFTSAERRIIAIALRALSDAKQP